MVLRPDTFFYELYDKTGGGTRKNDVSIAIPESVPQNQKLFIIRSCLINSFLVCLIIY